MGVAAQLAQMLVPDATARELTLFRAFVEAGFDTMHGERISFDRLKEEVDSCRRALALFAGAPAAAPGHPCLLPSSQCKMQAH